MIDQSPFGCCSHQLHDAGLELLAAAGIRWHRVDFNWPDLEPQRGVMAWADSDRLVATAERLGLSLLGVMAYTPAWESGSANPAQPPREPARYLDFVRATVERYRGRVPAWSIWNEPNLRQFWNGDQGAFVDRIFAPGLATLKVVDPGALTVGPDLSSAHDNRALRDWLPVCLKASSGLLDVVSHHQYDGGDTLSGRVKELERVRAFMVGNGQGRLPFWLTETGADRMTPHQQAELLKGTLLAMLQRPWWSKTFWYDSHGPKWGLLETDGTPQAGQPRPAYFAYQDLIAATQPSTRLAQPGKGERT